MVRAPAALSLSMDSSELVPLLVPVDLWPEEEVVMEPEAVGPAVEVPLFTGKGATREVAVAVATSAEVTAEEASAIALSTAVSAGAEASEMELVMLSAAEETALTMSVLAAAAEEMALATAVFSATASATAELTSESEAVIMSVLHRRRFCSSEAKRTVSDGLLDSAGRGDLVELVGVVNASGESRCSEGEDEGGGAHDG